MKQVVIRGEYNTDNLLTPYWTKEFLKRKGYKEIYVYERIEIGGLDRLKKVKDTELLNYGYYNYNPFHYTTVDINNNITYDDFISYHRNDIIFIGKILRNREDEDLITIVKLINNADKVKIIEIPDDVQYYIEKGVYNIEYIKEKSREWK